MSLADKLREATRSTPGLPCGVAKLMTTLNEEDKKALEIVFSTKSVSGTISNVQLHELFLSEGYNVAFASIRLHRSQRCRCYISRDAQRAAAAAKDKK